MSAFSARGARGDRPAQAGRGSGASGERDAAAGCISLFPIYYRPNQTATATGFVELVLPMLPPIAPSLISKKSAATSFREPLQFIVIAVMSVISDTFPDTYGLFYVTINSWRVRGPSRHRHGERHRRNALPKRLTRRRDGDDAHDADIRSYSR